MKTLSKYLTIFSGLLALHSLSFARSEQIICDPNARPVFCTPVYSPVCAYPEGCENSLCSYTAINACAACGQSDVVSYTLGECFYNSTDVYDYLNEGSENNGEELEHTGEETANNGEQPTETGETGEHEEGSLEEGGSQETEQPTEQENEEEQVEVEQPTEQETEEEEEEEEEVPTEEEPEQSENEETVTPPNPGGGTPGCPTTGVLVFVNGKFIQGTYCCGAASSCNNKVNPVCGSLNQCVGSLCRQTKINNCNACQDPNVRLYFPGTCRQLFGDAEANIEPDGGDNNNPEDSELDTEEEDLGSDIDDFRLLQFDDSMLNIYLD